ncbi:TorD/DmsD family molecular chaperone [Archaeoglobus sp.]
MEVTELRALAYKYASELVDYPYDDEIKKMNERLLDFISIFRLLEQVDEIYKGLSKIAEESLIILDEIRKLGTDDFQAEYVATFDLGHPKPKCPPYEREYLHISTKSDIKGELEVLDEITKFYSEYGAFVENENPDHIAVELEFMFYLVANELEALKKKSDVSKFRMAQIEFLDRHILNWIGKFRECVEVNSNLKGYANILKTIENFAKRDYKFLKNKI